MIIVDELVLSHQDQAQTYHSAHHFFHGDLGLECLKRRLLKN